MIPSGSNKVPPSLQNKSFESNTKVSPSNTRSSIAVPRPNKLPPPPGYVPPNLTKSAVNVTTASVTKIVRSNAPNNSNSTATITTTTNVRLPLDRGILSVPVLNPVPAGKIMPAPQKYTHFSGIFTQPRPPAVVVSSQPPPRFTFSFDDGSVPSLHRSSDSNSSRLAPKFQNPSLPDLSKMSRQSPLEEFEDKNPFRNSDLYDPTEVNAKVVKLGEDFFASLFEIVSNSRSNSRVKINPTQQLTNTIPDPLSSATKPKQQAPAPFSGAVPSSVMAPINMQSPQAKTGLENPPPVPTSEDKYAALKDLDDIFKTAVVVSDGEKCLNLSANNLINVINVIDIVRSNNRKCSVWIILSSDHISYSWHGWKPATVCLTPESWKQ